MSPGGRDRVPTHGLGQPKKVTGQLLLSQSNCRYRFAFINATQWDAGSEAYVSATPPLPPGIS